jgi:AmmeMemoRadiSam system protein A
MSYDHELTDDEKRELLRIARATLREHSRTGRIPPGKPHRASLTDEAAVFVTLHRGHALRGCIGTLHETKPLYKAVQEMAIAAATRDTRFGAVTEEEVPALTIEISVLGGHRRIASPDDIEIGRHGLVLSAGGHRGLLLPQVAVEHGWDAGTFLDKVCEKAGLAPGAWRSPDAELETFTAQVFDERSHPPLQQPRRS